ncbi:WD40-repeat-containing domain protein, partial [Diplogelasinospora grovesii]
MTGEKEKEIMTEKIPRSPSEAKSSATLTNSLLSSPPRLPPSSQNSKERRNPSITPKKFKRFFTPRSRVSSKPSAARKALHDLTAPALNRCQTPSSPLKPISEDNDELPSLHDAHRGAKRRKTVHYATPDRKRPCEQLPTPLNTSPVLFQTPDNTRSALRSPIQTLQSSQSTIQDVSDLEDEAFSDDGEELPGETRLLRRPVQLYRRGMAAQLVQRMTGGLPTGGYGRLSCPISDWRTEAADFCSKPEDVHLCSSHEGEPRTIPFCTTSCHKSSLVAVGDEEGYIRLLDSARNFPRIHLSFHVHGNAIIDLAFSEDDYLLATASGDQTGKVIDVMTQTPISVLGRHTASLKQVRFQPGRGSGSVLATSGRDGSVQIWDLRCRGGTPVQDIQTQVRSDSGLHHRLPRRVNQGCVVNSIYDAHARITHRRTPNQATASGVGDVARMGEVPGRIGEVSVTALQFLPPGREHLLLTGCEADASIKLWDIRAVHTRHHKSSTSTPISFTAPPASHVAWRPFGVSAMGLNGDGSRLYSLCKDNTVYAYSTAHLVLGHATELAPALPGQDPPRFRRHGAAAGAHEGLGPLYGFRHPLFHATSFYVKAAVRPARNGNSELLAVGSSDGAAILFPTDERYLKEHWQRQQLNEGVGEESYLVGKTTDSAAESLGLSRRMPSLSRQNSGSGGLGGSFGGFGGSFSGSQAVEGSPPIIRNIGTPLVRGHDKEVGALTWTADGDLVTVGDDYLVRCWREDRDAASDLRRGGETGGRRWGCGWADVGDAWDGDDDDW